MDQWKKIEIKNGYDMILKSYNKQGHPIIEDETNALVFPWDMIRDVDYIDTMRFYSNEEK